VTLVLAFPVTIHAQAAAESALTNALSSSTTVKAGSALNHALNQSSSQLGTHIPERTSSPVQVGAQQQQQPRAPRTELKNPNTGSLAHGATGANSSPAMGGISVQGGETTCTSASPGSHASPDPTNSGMASVDCRGKRPAPDAGTTDKYKSFVTLSFPK
jgi:hypothetical protein